MEKRLTHYKEFVQALSDDAAKTQGARCMDCGIRFCNDGCPVNNVTRTGMIWFSVATGSGAGHAGSTNNLPDFTGRICPARLARLPVRSGINAAPVGIEFDRGATIIDKGWEMGWVVPQPAAVKTGKKVAVVGSQPAGMAAAQQLARVGHDVTVLKSGRIGSLLGFGIPDFKLNKSSSTAACPRCRLKA